MRSDTEIAISLGRQLSADNASPVEAMEAVEAAFPARAYKPRSIALSIAFSKRPRNKQEN